MNKCPTKDNKWFICIEKHKTCDSLLWKGSVRIQLKEKSYLYIRYYEFALGWTIMSQIKYYFLYFLISNMIQYHGMLVKRLENEDKDIMWFYVKYIYIYI